MFPQPRGWTPFDDRRTGCTLAHDPQTIPTKEESMYARVVRWEGAEAESMERAASEIRTQAEDRDGPPEGVPAKGLLILNDAESGRSLAISLFETEDDYREGDETLNAMSPPDEGFGKRVSVEKYEVAVQLEA
jgi:hypothetical protein